MYYIYYSKWDYKQDLFVFTAVSLCGTKKIGAIKTDGNERSRQFGKYKKGK